MGVFDGMNENVRKTGQEWADWAKRHAREIGDRGMRHLERQDLLAERKRLVVRVGEYVVSKLVDQGAKTIRGDASELVELTGGIQTIDRRLEELRTEDDDLSQPGTDNTKNG